MATRTTRLCALALALSASALTTDRTAAQTGPRWRPSFEHALEEARQEGLPLLVCFNQDCAKTNDVMAHTTFRSKALQKALTGVVPVIASPDHHAGDGDACPRFPGLRCVEHQACDAAARRHLFGHAGGVTAPQQVLLYPDGQIAWHDLYQCRATDITRAIRTAKTAIKKGAAYRLRQQKASMRRFIAKAHRDSDAFHLARTMLAHAETDEFAQLWKLVRIKPAAGRLLRDLAALPVDRAEPRVAMVARGQDDRVSGLARQLSTKIRERKQHGSHVGGPEVTEPLPSLGAAQNLDDVVFAGDTRPSIEAGRITVLWFFLPDWNELPYFAERFNRWAAAMEQRGVRMIGLGATLHPDADLPAIEKLGFEFPVGAYEYSAAEALCGMKLFPGIVVLDPNRQVVYRSNHYSEFEKLVSNMLELPEYRARLRGTGDQPVARRSRLRSARPR